MGELKRLHKTWEKRCATAHAGRLHGVERVFGMPLRFSIDLELRPRPQLSIESGDDESLFVLELLLAVRRHTRRLLVKLLDPNRPKDQR